MVDAPGPSSSDRSRDKNLFEQIRSRFTSDSNDSDEDNRFPNIRHKSEESGSSADDYDSDNFYFS